jgi:hypothetical protein
MGVRQLLQELQRVVCLRGAGDEERKQKGSHGALVPKSLLSRRNSAALFVYTFLAAPLRRHQPLR